MAFCPKRRPGLLQLPARNPTILRRRVPTALDFVEWLFPVNVGAIVWWSPPTTLLKLTPDAPLLYFNWRNWQ
jgi:hypothetical protein